MSRYSCKCPAHGCETVFEVEGKSWESAFKKMYAQGNRHVIDCHPDMPEADDRVGEAREYAKREMKKL